MSGPTPTRVSPCGLFKIPGTPPSLRRRPRSPTVRAGLCFPVGRIHHLLYNLLPAGKCPTKISAVFLAAVLEYLTAEVIEVGGDISHEKGLCRITARHVQHAIRADAEVDYLVRETIRFHRNSLASMSADDSDDDDEPSPIRERWPDRESVPGTSGGKTGVDEDFFAAQEDFAATEPAFLEFNESNADVLD